MHARGEFLHVVEECCCRCLRRRRLRCPGKRSCCERSAFLVPISGAVYNALLHPITFGVQPPPPGHRLKVADFYDHNGHLRI